MLKFEIGKKQEVFILVGLIIILAVMAIVLYQLISFKTEEIPEVTTPLIKTQAARKTYRKEMALNLTTPSPTSEPSPTSSNLTPSPTLLAQASFEDLLSTQEASLTPSLTPTITPTPTDIIIAKMSPSPENVNEETPTSTPVESLPKAGYSYYYLLLFAAGAFIIVFSLVI